LVLAAAIAVFAQERVSAPLGAPTEYGPEWLRVPGGHIIHRDCIHEVEDGATVGEHTFAPCKNIFRQQPNVQIYSIDVHWTTKDVIMKMFNSSFTTPGNHLVRLVKLTISGPDSRALSRQWVCQSSSQCCNTAPATNGLFALGTCTVTLVRLLHHHRSRSDLMTLPSVT